ncbi:hypothetical protein EDD22DRAFT_850613 [Suillus occidentalis]|nr:hypothetical protein EDD22DRAFT_850613 [Suillus occidentalis]
MSLDSLDDIYLGPDDELNSNSGPSGDLDVLDEIPTQSYPEQADDLPLFNDLDLYLGPEDDLINFDNTLAVLDSPITVNESTPKPYPASLAVPEAPILYVNCPSCHSTMKNCVPWFRSSCQLDLMTKLKHYGHVPDPTVVGKSGAERMVE